MGSSLVKSGSKLLTSSLDFYQTERGNKEMSKTRAFVSILLLSAPRFPP